MKKMGSRAVSGVALAAIVLTICGCGRQGLHLNEPLVTSLPGVPASAVLKAATLTRQDFMINGPENRFSPLNEPIRVRWINEERIGELCQDYFAKSRLFQTVDVEASPNPSEMCVILRPHVTLSQYLCPSLAGTVLTFGTGLIYSFLGGSSMDRYVDCELTLDVLTPAGRHVATYFSSCRSPEQLATEAADQLGPLASIAFTRAIEDVGGQISADRDLLMRSLAADMSEKGVVPLGTVRINIRSPKGMIVRDRKSRITGQIVGADDPVELVWTLNGSRPERVPLTTTATQSVKEFSFDATLDEGIARVGLALYRKGMDTSADSRLAAAEIPFLVAPGPGETLPLVRKCWAVVIGISKYKNAGKRFTNLEYAAEDAKAFYDFLCSNKSKGFARERILCLVNEQVTYSGIRHALFEFLAQADKDDLVLIYFSGHGVPEPGTEDFFMLCHDTDPDHMASTAFPMWDIDTALRRRFIKAERVVVLADACHAGGIANEPGAKAATDNPVHLYLQQLALAEKGRLFLTASESRELSFESSKFGGGHGVFTHFLLQGLSGLADANKDGVVTAGELVEFVRGNVITATGNKQHPKLAGDFDRNLPLAVVEHP